LPRAPSEPEHHNVSNERGELAALTALLQQLVEQIAQRVVSELAELEGDSRTADARSPWMSIEAAASYLDWPKQRLYKLTASGAIPHHKHERRLLFRRDELDRWLASFAQGERRSLSRSRSI